MRVTVDRERCQGHNRCNMTCPEVYRIDDEGLAVVQVDVIPAHLEERARRAAETCPEAAIDGLD